MAYAWRFRKGGVVREEYVESVKDAIQQSVCAPSPVAKRRYLQLLLARWFRGLTLLKEAAEAEAWAA
jgi:hypothetical protein